MATIDPVARAKRAQAILNDPLWQEAWDHLRERITHAAMLAKTDEGTLKGKTMLGLTVDLRLLFERVIKDGAIAAENIRLEAEDRKRRWPFAA